MLIHLLSYPGAKGLNPSILNFFSEENFDCGLRTYGTNTVLGNVHDNGIKPYSFSDVYWKRVFKDHP